MVGRHPTIDPWMAQLAHPYSILGHREPATGQGTAIASRTSGVERQEPPARALRMDTRPRRPGALVRGTEHSHGGKVQIERTDRTSGEYAASKNPARSRTGHSR